jgi:hypothetical protein
MARRNKQFAAVLGIALVVAVVLVLVLRSDSSPNGGSGQTPSYSGTATVRRRDLVSTDTESGTLSYANPQTVYNNLSGTITWLPAAGRVIKPGRALFDIDNEPVLLMNGATPAYRNLTSSDTSGPDILELNRNLVALGYAPYTIVIADEWQSATTAGVEALQKAEGWYQSGTLTLGQIDFLPGTQLVATVAGTLGSSVAGGSSAAVATTAPLSSEGEGSAGAGASSSGGGAATEILTTNSTRLVVTVDLSASLQSEATLGEQVSVQMPDGSTVGGKVAAVSSVAQSSDSGANGSGGSGAGSGDSGSSATVPVTITLDKRAKGAGLDQASVSVSFTQAKANNVLSVPVTALIATSGRKFAIQEVVAPYNLIHVTTGLFAAGDVQISGLGIYQGLKVTDSQG